MKSKLNSRKSYLKFLHNGTFVTVSSSKGTGVGEHKIMLISPTDHMVILTETALQEAKEVARQQCNLLNVPFIYNGKVDCEPSRKNSVLIYDLKANRKNLSFNEVYVNVKTEIHTVVKGNKVNIELHNFKRKLENA